MFVTGQVPINQPQLQFFIEQLQQVLDKSSKITRLFSLSRPKFLSDHIFWFVATRAAKTKFAPTKPSFVTHLCSHVLAQ